MLGMIIALDHSKFMQKDDVLDIYEKVHGHYYDHLELFLVLLGLGIAIFGFIIPRMINKNIEKSEKRIENEIDRFDRRINETIEKKVQSEFDLKIEEKVKELEDNFEDDLNFLESKISADVFRNLAFVQLSNSQFELEISFYLFAIEHSAMIEDWETINDINTDLKKYLDGKVKINLKLIYRLRTGNTIEYKEDLLEMVKDDIDGKRAILKVIDTCDSIINIYKVNNKN